jgi:hypothetical protein
LRKTIASMLAAVAIPLPIGWPHHLALGVADQPDDAATLVRHAPFDLRYQYLAGGVDTGGGWATWNPNGTFVSLYVAESQRSHLIPVFTYYQLLQSHPAVGNTEQQKDISNLRNPATMSAYWADYSLLLRRINAAAGTRPVVVHLEPDLWGYLEQAGDVALARALAQRFIALRNQLAPHVELAWHLSTWGTGEDPTYSKPSLAHMVALAQRSAGFYEALHAHFDLVFNDVTDRDAGFYLKIEGNPNTAWAAGDFQRHTRYIAAFSQLTHEPIVYWQLPLGNTSLNNTWTHYRDNRVQWWLGDPTGAHLRAERAAGVIGLLFGGGADGTTGPQTDGGLFWRLSAAYLAHPLAF